MPKADIRINVGADTGVSTDILKQDLDKIALKLSNKANRPKIEIGIDVPKTRDNFKTQLQSIVSNLKLKANVSLNTGNSSKSNNSSNTSGNNSSNVIDVKKLSRDIDVGNDKIKSFYFGSKQIIKKIKDDFKDLGTVNVSNVFNDKGKISSFTASVTKASGEIKKFEYNSAKIKVGKSIQSGWVYADASKTDKSLGGDVLKQSNSLYGERLSILKSIGNKEAELAKIDANSNKAIALQDVINKGKSRIGVIDQEIQKIGTLSNTKEQQNRIDKQLIDNADKLAIAQGYKTDSITKSNMANSKTPTDIALMEQNVKKTELTFQKLSNAPRNVANSVIHLQTKLDALQNAKTPEKQKEAFDKLNNSLKVTNAYMQNLNTGQRSKTSFTTQSNNLERQIRNYLKTNTRVEDSSYGIKMNSLVTGLSSGKIDPKNINRASAAFAKLRAEANAAGLEGQNMWDKLTGKYAEYSRFLLVSGSIALLRRSFAQMVQVVKELNQEFVNIQMVTGGTQRETAILMKTYNQMAQQLGSTTKEVSVSANEFLRQGLSITDTNKLIETSMVLSKVGMLSSADATQYLTSAMKGYKISAENALSIVDKVSTVDMVSATSASGLMEGMSRVANMADTVGFSMDRLLATIATIGEVTQRDMSSVGDSLRTMFARMSNIKVGKLVDSETQESLSDVETVLGNVGIKLRENETDFRNYGDILDEVAGRWASFNDVQRNSISTAFAGQRRIEDFLTLMNNYDNILAYTEESINSTGSAMKKFETYQSGIEASIKRFTAAFEGLLQSLIKSGFIKALVNLGTVILNILNSGFGKFAITTTAVTFALKGVIMLLPIIAKQLAAISIAATISSGGIAGLTGAIKGLWTVILTSPLTPFIIAATALVAIFAGISAAANHNKEALEKAKSTYMDATAKVKSINDELKTMSERIAELNAKLGLTFVEREELENLKKTTAELERQKVIADALASGAKGKLYTKFIKNAEAEKGKMEADLGYYHYFDTMKSFEERLGAETSKSGQKVLQRNLNDVKNQISSHYKELSELSEGIEYIKNPTTEDERKVNEWLDYINDFGDRMAIAFGTEGAKSSALTRLLGKDEYSGIKEQLDTLGETGELTGEKIRELIPITSELYDKLVDLGAIAKDDVIATMKSFQEGGSVNLFVRPQIDTSVLKSAGWEDVGEGIATLFSSTFSNELGNVAMNFTPIIADENGNFIDVLSPSSLQEYAEGVISGVREDDLNLKIGSTFSGKSAIKKASDTANRIHELQEKFYLDDKPPQGSWYDDLANTFNKVEDEATTISLSISTLKKELEKIQSVYNDVASAIEEYNENGYLSIESLEKLLDIAPAYLSHLIDENGQLTLNKESLQELTIARIEELGVQSMLDLIDNVTKLEGEVSQLKLLTDATQDLTASKWDLVAVQLEEARLSGKITNRVYNELIKQAAIRKSWVDATIEGVRSGSLNKNSKKTSEKDYKDKVGEIQSDLAEKERKFAKSMAEAWEKDHLETLKDGLAKQKDILSQYEKNLTNLDFGLKLADKSDFGLQSDLLSEKLETLTEHGSAMRAEFDRILQIAPQTGEEATEIANRITELGDAMRGTVSSIREVSVEILQMRINALSSISGNYLSAFTKEIDSIDKRIDILKSDNKNDYSYLDKVLSTKTLLPLYSDFDKQRSQRRRQDRELISDTQKTQDTINKVVTDALDRLAKDNARKREEERQELIKDMEKARKDAAKKMDEALKDYKGKLDTAKMDTKSASDFIRESLKNSAADGVDTTKFDQDVDHMIGKLKTLQSVAEEARKAREIEVTEAWEKGFSGSFYGDDPKNSSAKGIPIGATVYMSSKNPAGHVGISDGKGNIISNEGGKVTIKSFDKMFESGYYKYRGWGYNGGVEITPEQGKKIVDKALSKTVKAIDGQCQAFVADVYATSLNKARVSAPTAREAGDKWIISKAYAKGTPYHPGGLALLGDEGKGKYEAAILPNGEVQIVGENGAELVDLPKGTQVIPHDETKELLNSNENTSLSNGSISSIQEDIDGITGAYSVKTGETIRDFRIKERDIRSRTDLTDDEMADLLSELKSDFIKTASEVAASFYEQVSEEFINYDLKTQSGELLFSQDIVDGYTDLLSTIEDEVISLSESLVAESERKIDEFEKDWENSLSWISDRNFYGDWGGDSEVKSYGRMRDKLNKALNDGILSWDTYYEKLKELRRLSFSAAKDELTSYFEKELELEEKSIEKQKERLDLQSSKYSSQATLLQANFDLLNSIRDARHDIDKELKASMALYEYTNANTRELLFNQKDYNILSGELNNIQLQANRLKSKYINDIQNAEKENIAEITMQYQKQYDLQMKKYEITKAELEIVKKRQQLDNVLAERNVKMFVNGRWTQVANTQDVINAQNELAEAEYLRENAEISLSQTKSLNTLELAQSSIATTVNLLDSDLVKAREKWNKILSSFDTPTSSLATILQDIADSDCVQLQSIVSRITGSIIDLNEKLTGEKFKFPLNSSLGKTSPEEYARNMFSGGKVSVGYANAYASGARNTKSGYATLGENGEEILVTSQGNFVPITTPILTKLSGNNAVFSNQMVGKLWDIANNPLSAISSMFGKSTTTQTVEPVTIGEINIYNPVDFEDVKRNIVNGINMNRRSK